MTAREGPALPAHQSIAELLAGTAVVALVPATAELEKAAIMAWQLAREAANSGRKVALVDCFVEEPRLHAVAGEPNREGIVDVFEYGASLSHIARQQPEENLYFLPAGTFAPDPDALMGNRRWRRLSAGFRHEEAVMLLFLPAESIAAIAPVLDGIVALAPGGADAGRAARPEIRAAVARGVRLLATLAGVDVLAGPLSAAAAQTEAPAPVSRELPRHGEPEARAGQRAGPGPAPTPAAKPQSAPASGRGSKVQPGPAPSATAQSQPPPARSAAVQAAPMQLLIAGRHARGPRRARARWALFVPLLLLALGAGVVSYRSQLGIGDLGLGGLGLGTAPEPESATAQVVPTFRRLVPHPADSLPFAVQVSAWTSLAFALDAADALEGAGFLPIVSPLRLGGRPWYRVFVGPVATQDEADSLLGSVRAAGFDRPETAASTLVPWSLAVKRVATPAVARAERARLRAAGIPVFVLGLADGSYGLLAGAYQTADQATYLDSLITSTGGAAQLGPRVGFRP